METYKKYEIAFPPYVARKSRPNERMTSLVLKQRLLFYPCVDELSFLLSSGQTQASFSLSDGLALFPLAVLKKGGRKA